MNKFSEKELAIRQFVCMLMNKMLEGAYEEKIEPKHLCKNTVLGKKLLEKPFRSAVMYSVIIAQTVLVAEYVTPPEKEPYVVVREYSLVDGSSAGIVASIDV